MTVQELIEKLSTYPSDAIVYVRDWNENYAEPTELLSYTVDIDREERKVYLA